MKKLILCLSLFFCLGYGCQKPDEFHHVLLYTFSENVENQRTRLFLDLFEKMPSKLKGLEKVAISKIENSSIDYDVIIDLTFSSKISLEDYQNHVDHKKIELMASEVIQNYSFFQYSTE